jgi:hypothetical protein
MMAFDVCEMRLPTVSTGLSAMCNYTSSYMFRRFMFPDSSYGFGVFVTHEETSLPSASAVWKTINAWCSALFFPFFFIRFPR